MATKKLKGLGRGLEALLGPKVSENAADDSATSSASPGYAVFGKVTTGIAVINAIGSVPTGTSNGLTDVPTTEVVITSMKRIK